MIAEGNRCFAQALPSVPEIIREILGERAASVVVQQSCSSPSSIHCLQW